MGTTLDKALQFMLKIERETGGFATMRASMDGSLILELVLGDGRKPGCIIDRELIKHRELDQLKLEVERMIRRVSGSV